jgi:hypothetical protein
MKIKKLIVSEETLIWDWKKDPYRRQVDIYNMEWELLYSFDPCNTQLDVRIKEMFRN